MKYIYYKCLLAIGEKGRYPRYRFMTHLELPISITLLTEDTAIVVLSSESIAKNYCCLIILIQLQIMVI